MPLVDSASNTSLPSVRPRGPMISHGVLPAWSGRLLVEQRRTLLTGGGIDRPAKETELPIVVLAWLAGEVELRQRRHVAPPAPDLLRLSFQQFKDGAQAVIGAGGVGQARQGRVAQQSAPDDFPAQLLYRAPPDVLGHLEDHVAAPAGLDHQVGQR